MLNTEQARGRRRVNHAGADDTSQDNGRTYSQTEGVLRLPHGLNADISDPGESMLADAERIAGAKQA